MPNTDNFTYNFMSGDLASAWDQVLGWGRGVRTGKNTDLQVNCIEVTPNSSDHLYST